MQVCRPSRSPSARNPLSGVGQKQPRKPENTGDKRLRQGLNLRFPSWSKRDKAGKHRLSAAFLTFSFVKEFGRLKAGFAESVHRKNRISPRRLGSDLSSSELIFTARPPAGSILSLSKILTCRPYPRGGRLGEYRPALRACGALRLCQRLRLRRCSPLVSALGPSARDTCAQVSTLQPAKYQREQQPR